MNQTLKTVRLPNGLYLSRAETHKKANKIYVNLFIYNTFCMKKYSHYVSRYIGFSKY